MPPSDLTDHLNLKDIGGTGYGGYFPPIKSKLVIIDEEGREFPVIKVGNNQISGDLFSFFKANQLEPGDVISVEYDREELSEDRRHILHLKSKKLDTSETDQIES